MTRLGPALACVALALTSACSSGGGVATNAGTPGGGILPNSSAASAVGTQLAVPGQPNPSIKEFPVNDTLNGDITVGNLGSEELVYATGKTSIERLLANGTFASIAFPVDTVSNPQPTQTIPDGGFGSLGIGPGNTVVAGAGFAPASRFPSDPQVCCGVVIGVPVGQSKAKVLIPSDSPLDTVGDQSIFGGIALGSDGDLWFVQNTQQTDSLGTIFFADPTYKHVASLDFRGQTSFIGPLVSGPDKMIWAAGVPPPLPQNDPPFPPELIRVNPATKSVINTFTLPPTSNVKQMVAGSDGAIWFADAGLNAIGRVTPTGAMKFFPVLTPNAGLAGIAHGIGGDSGFWFTETTANKIGHISTSGIVFEEAVPTANAGLGQMASAAAGAIFFTETHAIGKIAK